uniref:Uncharacterized protein n=1 Tax=Cacopsylla melanoneura TaxID=428564 RepID=A0A8D9B9V0_9HEMI
MYSIHRSVKHVNSCSSVHRGVHTVHLARDLFTIQHSRRALPVHNKVFQILVNSVHRCVHFVHPESIVSTGVNTSLSHDLFTIQHSRRTLPVHNKVFQILLDSVHRCVHFVHPESIVSTGVYTSLT